jgi:NarL family two-component system response regulator LiaR
MLGVEDHIQVVGEASNGREAVEQAAVLRPDIVLMDLQMPELDGISAIRVIRERVPATYVLVLTSFTTEGYVRPAIEAGAAGYLLKDATRTQVVHAIEAAARGQAPLDPVVARQVMAWVAAPPEAAPTPQPSLTPRELDVLRLVSQGKRNKEIARVLGMSEHTVKQHIKGLLPKLESQDRTQAALAAVRLGLVSLSDNS